MKSKGSHEFNSYLRRIEDLYKDNKISRDKRDRLLMSASEIPEDFIERDLRLTQYITTKSLEILSGAIRNVYASSGIVTDFFRHAWGYDTILHDLNLPRYEAGDLTEKVEYETHGQKHSAMRIRNWSKRKDHRHHALDALVIALTRQGYIQRLNSLNADSGNSDKSSKWRSLDKWASERPHFERRNVIQTMEEISISFKPGKKLATPENVISAGMANAYVCKPACPFPSSATQRYRLRQHPDRRWRKEPEIRPRESRTRNRQSYPTAT